MRLVDPFLAESRPDPRRAGSIDHHALHDLISSKVPASASRFAALIALLLACGVATGCGGGRQRQLLTVKDSAESSAAGAVTSAGGSPFRFFSPRSFWNKPVPAGASRDPSSAAVVAAFDGEIAAEESAKRGPWINISAYSVPIYTVSASQPAVRVQLVGHPRGYGLQAAWDAVPLPPTAQPAPGSDGHLVVWQPSANRLWEFYRLVDGPEGWHASWGGAMRKVSSNPGVYGSNAWPGAKSSWGASASSLSIAGGLITLEDLQRGQINHALAIAVPNVRGGVYASPARRTDGTSTYPLSLPEGAHLRLDPKLDLAALHLPRLTLMMAKAAQRYGIFVRDGAADVISFDAQDPIPTGTNPYAGAGGYLEGRYPNQILAAFPWSRLQLLEMTLHRIGGHRKRSGR